MKRFILWSAGIFLALIVAGVLASRLSPWPSLAVIRFMFWRGEQASEAALEKHLLPAGIVTRRDVAYGKGPNETFDLYHPDKATGLQPTIVWVHGGGFIGGSKGGI